MESKNLKIEELSDDALENVVGGLEIGETIRLKSGTTVCSECGIRNIKTFVYEGNGDSLRMALVTFPCGHQTYISEGAVESM